MVTRCMPTFTIKINQMQGIDYRVYIPYLDHKAKILFKYVISTHHLKLKSIQLLKNGSLEIQLPKVQLRNQCASECPLMSHPWDIRWFSWDPQKAASHTNRQKILQNFITNIQTLIPKELLSDSKLTPRLIFLPRKSKHKSLAEFNASTCFDGLLRALKLFQWCNGPSLKKDQRLHLVSKSIVFSFSFLKHVATTIFCPSSSNIMESTLGPMHQRLPIGSTMVVFGTLITSQKTRTPQ